MRRFLDWTATQTAAGGSSGGIGPMSPANTKRGSSQASAGLPASLSAMDLELQQLTKLLHEIKYYQASSSPLPSAISSANQREFIDKVHKTLPLFLNVFGANLIQQTTTSDGYSSFILNESQCSLFNDGNSTPSTSSKPSSPLPPHSPPIDKFPDLLPFAFTIARLFVSEVRQRASNKHAEDASLAILEYLNSKPSGNNQLQSKNDKTDVRRVGDTMQQEAPLSETKFGQAKHDATLATTIEATNQVGQGWNLLLSLNILASSQNPQIIQLLCDASLPSTLMKCLYLFFDLPSTLKSKQANTRATSTAPADLQQDTFAATAPNELITSALVSALTQILVQLCSYQSAIDELIKKDDLRLLIGIASSQCLPHNKTWRKTAFQTLLAISKNMRDNFMYLEQNVCIQVFVENMHRINSLGLASIEDFIDMIRVLLAFLYNLDANNRNQAQSIAPLIDQLKNSRLMELIEELLFKIDDTIAQETQHQMSVCSPLPPMHSVDSDAAAARDGSPDNYQTMSHQPSVSSEAGICVDDFRRYGRRLIHCFTFMAKIYSSQEQMARNTTLKPLTMSRFEMLENFRMPRPSARDCILNNEALRLFKLIWSKCRDSHLIEAVLDATISLFNDDKYNYFIFESQQLLVYYMSSSNFNQFPTKVKQKLFKFLEFIIIETNYIPCLELGTLGTLIKSKATSDSTRKLALRTLTACLRFESRFSDIFRDIGLLEVIIESLIDIMQNEKLISQNVDKLEVLYLLLEASQYLLAGPNNSNCMQFNESGAARYVFNCLSKPRFFHLFVPAHSSSSDDGGAGGSVASNTSRNSTPTPTRLGKLRQQQHPTIQTNSHWVEPAFSRTQSRPSIKQMQKVAFTIIRQLILSNAGDEHLANLLGLLARTFEDLKSLDEQEKDKSGDNESLKQQPQYAATTYRTDLTFLLAQEVNLKIYILKSLIIILKDSHRCRTLFRKVGGFVYIVASLTTLEGALPLCNQIDLHENELDEHNRWRKVNTRRIWRLIKNSLMAIVVAMRSEPSNMRVFSDEVLNKFTDALRKLGCFKSKQLSLTRLERSAILLGPKDESFDSFKSIFLSPPARDFSTIPNEFMQPNEACCQLFRYLYDVSLDMADGTHELEAQLHEESISSGLVRATNLQAAPAAQDTKSISFDQGASDSTSQAHNGIFKRRSHLQKSSAKPPSLDLDSCSPEPAILTFPSIILCMLDLVPSCPSEDLMIFTSLVIKTLFKHERNQQVLCEAGMISKLLAPSWRVALTDKSHFLHNIVETMFESMTKQVITPKELRTFLRLEDPLCCKNLDDIETETRDSLENAKRLETGALDSSLAVSSCPKSKKQENKEKILTDRIATFVNMMSDERAKLQPPYIEFDMSSEGCSTVFMPSIAPVNAKSLPPNTSSFLNSTLDIHTGEKNGILGGVGTSERRFPPQHGLTFSSWICIEKFPARSPDANHNIRLLTIYRGSAATGKEYSCFRVHVSALDRALILSTQETLLFDNENKQDAQLDPDCHLRVWTPETLIEGKWHHVATTLIRSSHRQGMAHVYIDGSLVHNQRIGYINDFVGSPETGPLGNASPSSGSCSAAAFVNAFIGPLPQYRLKLKTCWKQGPCHLIEEALSANSIQSIYLLGPNYIGNFQNTTKLGGNLNLQRPGSSKFESKYQRQQQQQQQQQHSEGIQRSVSVAQNNQPRHVVPLSRVSSSGLAQSSSVSQQAVSTRNGHSNSNQLHLSEDRILMNLDARATSLMTLSRMRRIYTRFDCRQVSRVLGLSMHENSVPILLLHNTGVHLNGPSCGIGAVTIGYDHIRCFVPSPTELTLMSVGGSYVLLGLVAQSQNVQAFYASLRALLYAMVSNPRLQVQMDSINGYQMLTVFFWRKKHLLNVDILKLIFALVTGGTKATDSSSSLLFERNKSSVQSGAGMKSIRQVGALRDLICENFDLWLQTGLINIVLEFIHDLISSTNSDNLNSIRTKNLKCLRDSDLLPRMLRLLPHDFNNAEPPSSTHSVDGQEQNQYDVKAIYLTKQTVFELLNRTPRQEDILYFGQFLASLLPAGTEERSAQTINLRNVLLKSLLQMMTKNKQKEVNDAMQEECVRILGFDWFMLFILGSHLNEETIALGFLNLMILLSNDDLYSSFKHKLVQNGGWLKEPTFPTIDGKFNIQLLGVNVGVFLGLSGKRKTMCQEVLEAPNFLLLSSCVSNLAELPRIYLMIFQTIMGRLSQLDSSVFDTIGNFDQLTLDILCDSLIGDTHHKRRQTLASIKFRSFELIVCLVHMIKSIVSNHSGGGDERSITTAGHERPLEDNQQTAVGSDQKRAVSTCEHFPTDIIRFFMYLYNNNGDFRSYCKHSDELMDALCETLMQDDSPGEKLCLSSDVPTPKKLVKRMTTHPASREILEFSRLILLDRMTEVYDLGADQQQQQQQNQQPLQCIEQLQPFERFFESLSACKEAQGELVDMLLRQILLMIDSTARHNSTRTLGGADNIKQFQLLLANSIIVSQVVTDKIWSQELYCDNLAQVLVILDHQLCLAEQIFRFNEILPKHNPPHAFLMQRVLNRTLLFAISRPLHHISDKILMLDLLKKIYENRTIIILNHMHSPQSAEFFVCFTYWLVRIIEDNLASPARRLAQNATLEQPASLIERQYGHPSSPSSGNRHAAADNPSSSGLMLVSLARKVWDAIYQSKKGLLSEAFDVSLSLPAFTLDTSLDLMQLKPDIQDTCERSWQSFVEVEQKPKQTLQQAKLRDSESLASSSTNAASAAVNMLSGRLTRVVNAASFVSRVVGATAGSMASNVNLVGERLTQNARQTKLTQRSPSDLGCPSANNNSGSPHNLVGGLKLQTSQLQSQTALQQHNHQHQQTSSFGPSVELFRYHSLNRQQVVKAHRAHISIIEDYIKSQLTQKNHKLALHKYLCDEWLDIEYEILLRERALFGPDRGSKLDKWCLDLTEGPRRMRKKMVNNTRQFYENYAHKPNEYNPDNKSLRYRPPTSHDSFLYHWKTLDLNKCLLDSPSDDKASISAATTAGGATAQEESRQRLARKDLEGAPDQLRATTPTNLSNTGSQEQLAARPDITVAAPRSVSPTSIASDRQREPVRRSQSPAMGSLEQTATRAKSGNSPEPLGNDAGDQDDCDATSFVDFSPEIEAETNSARESAENTDSLSVLRLLEKNERISHMFRCSRVQGLDTYEGLLLFGREHFYLIDGFTLLKTREIKDIDSLPPDAHDPIIPNSTPNILAHSRKTCSKFSYDRVVEVHKRRYLLQPIALEVFSSDGRNTLIVFPRNIRNKVYSRLMTVATQITNNAQDSLAGQKSNVSVEGGTGLLSNLIGETSVTQRWIRGELTNFQYLMNLNTIAGRSYNDLMQYPIFPWILADYSSDQLDLSKRSTFRDLSRPVGAQTSERLEQFKRRFVEWDDTETPPYHYGTFYSSAMIVASYMVRMEPFTQHFLRLQGGHFDLADRMFHSIHDSWLSASKHNMADIKELIPEFFYLPEFLVNENKYDLGIKQNGKKLNNVILPPWAKDDAREFIRLHRCALESDYVSAHLHEWIDLIFGYKQQGQAAIDAVNVFHHLFYEGNVDIYNTDIDPIKKNAVIGFINNFGQVPKQLFKKPHPQRKVSGSSLSPMPLTPILPSLSAGSSASLNQRSLTQCPQALRLTNATFKELRGPVGQIVQVDNKNIVAVEQNKLLIGPEYCRYVAWGHADRSLRLGLYDSEKPIFVWEGSDSLAPTEVLCCTIPNSRTMITAGTESLITVWKIERMRSFKPLTNLYGHVEPVTCLASSQSYSLIVSGSRDRTAIIWDLNRLTFVRQLGGFSNDQDATHQGPISAIAINDSTGDIATCAASWLYLWTINGQLLAQVDSFSVTIQQSMGLGTSMSSNMNQLHILSVCFSQNNDWDLNEVIVTGASDGTVALWSMRYDQRPVENPKQDAEVEKVGWQAECNLQTNGACRQPTDSSTNDKQDQQQYSASSAAQEQEGSQPNKPNPGAVSEPISIETGRPPRQRTDTINSDWVRLSTSSASTSDTLPVLQPTPTSQTSDLLTSSELLAGATHGNKRDELQNPLASSTPTGASTGFCEQMAANKISSTFEAADSTSLSNLSAVANQQQQRSFKNDSLDEQTPSKQNLYLMPNDSSVLKFSKSDTSLVDSFVILDDSPNNQATRASNQSVGEQENQARPKSSAGGQTDASRRQAGDPKTRRKLIGHMNRVTTADGDDELGRDRSLKLKLNHEWCRELYLRTVLNRRQGKSVPLAVTSLAISKDHRTLYIGDASGRISSWTTNN